MKDEMVFFKSQKVKLGAMRGKFQFDDQNRKVLEKNDGEWTQVEIEIEGNSYWRANVEVWVK